MLSGSAQQTGARRTVLVVEDNEINRETLRALLEQSFEVLQAANGLEGLEQLEARAADISLVLLDVFMPVCDGFEFLRRKAADERLDSIPVIVTTASGSAEDEVACLQLGANDFVVKPYNFKTLVNRVNNMIRLRESASIVNQLTWDGLTGLYSKEFFYRAVRDIFDRNPDTDYDIVCSDIDNFKSLNDRYGEQHCDALLRDLADYLMGILPGCVAGGRISGDTFAFLLEHQQPGWEGVLDGIPSGVGVPNLSVKFGVLECVDHDPKVALACDRATAALDKIKGPLGIAVARFDDEMRRKQQVEHIILDTMDQAVEQGQFEVHYQPKYDMRTGKTGGAEALVRWLHPELGFIQPRQFITFFERNGFITRLDMFVLEEVCKELKRCKELGLPVVPIAVNASRLDFDEQNLAMRITEIADMYGIEHSLLHIELTETAYSDNPEAVEVILNDLRERGFYIALDDFGAGYSSLSSLHTLPLDAMKLDMSMIRQATRLKDFRIVQSAIQLSKILGLENVVEGVELAEEVEKLGDMGCDFVQGYYYSKPLSRKEFEAHLSM